MTIYQRIGEAITSQGKVTLVAALTPDEEHILTTSGFKKVGTMDLNGVNIDLFEVKVTQVVNAPVKPYTGIRDTQPFPRSFPPQKYEAQWPDNYRLYTSGTGTPCNLNYRGSTSSLMDAAYNPLSILEDYFFPNTTDNSTHRTFKIDIGDITEAEQLKFIDKMKTEMHSHKEDYSNDSWTSYNRGYQGSRDFRNM